MTLIVASSSAIAIPAVIAMRGAVRPMMVMGVSERGPAHRGVVRGRVAPVMRAAVLGFAEHKRDQEDDQCTYRCVDQDTHSSPLSRRRTGPLPERRL